MLRKQGYQLPASEVDRNYFGSATRQAVLDLQRANRLPADGVVDEQTAGLLGCAPGNSAGVGLAKATRVPDRMQSTADPGQSQPFEDAGSQDVPEDIYFVSGSIWSNERGGVPGLRVLLVDKNIGPDVELAETATNTSGEYHITVSLASTSLQERRKTQPDLQVRVFAGESFLSASEVKYNASKRETIDVVLHVGLAALPSEYEALAANVREFYAGKFG